MRRAWSLLGLMVMVSVCMAQVRVPGPGGSGATGISFTDAQHHVDTPASCTNCATTITLGTGSLVVWMANGYINPVTISSVTGQTGLVHCVSGWNKGSSSTGYSDIAYVLSSTGQANPSVTFTGATGSTTNIETQEWTYANGPASVDICGSISNPSNTTTQAGVTPTYTGSGTNEATMQYASTAAAVNSVTNYASRDCNTNGQCWGTQTNSKTTTAPTYALSGAGITETGIFAAGKSTSSCESTIVMDFGGIVSGTQVSASALNTATHPVYVISPWGVTGTTGFKADTASKVALVNSIRNCSDGSTYSDSSTVGGKFDISTTDVINFGFVAHPDNLSIAYYLKTTVPNNDSGNQYDISTITSDTTGEKVIPNLFGNGTGLKLRMEVAGTSTVENDCGTNGDFVSNTQYLITVEYIRNVRYTLKLYNATTPSALTLVCTASGTPQHNEAINTVGLGHVGGVSAGSSLFFQYSQLKMSLDATYPLLN